MADGYILQVVPLPIACYTNAVSERRQKYTKSMLEDAVRDSRSMTEVLRKLGVRPAGGSHAHIRKRLLEFSIDTSHFLGKGWNIGGKQTGGPEKRAAYEILTLRNPTSRPEPTRFLRRALLEIGREYCCAKCGLGEVWNGQPLVLQIDHINGRRYDNRAENLRFLCPNCHSQTPNFNRQNVNGEVVEWQTRST